jgi:GNAT superfamily N-acetyltransferase
MSTLTARPIRGHCVIRVKGEDIDVSSLDLGLTRLVSTGSFLRQAKLFDEELVEAAKWPSVEQVRSAIAATRLRADLYSFARPFEPGFDLPGAHRESDNLAVLSTRSYDDWWVGLPRQTRRNVKIAEERGVVTRAVQLDDELAAGIKRIYDETPLRQGRRFWHFSRSLERVKEVNATYPDRSQFIGAYVDGELVGILKYVRVDRVAILIQILTMQAHRDKRAIFALLRHAVELCREQGLEDLVYGKFDYGVNRDSTLAEFKRRTGFVEHKFERFHVPMTWFGRLALSTGLHQSWHHILPIGVTSWLHGVRSKLLARLHGAQGQET